MKAASILTFCLGMSQLGLAGCSSVAGPHRMAMERAEGLQVVEIRGYGIHCVSAGVWNSFHLGSAEHLIVYEETQGGMESGSMPGDTGGFALLRWLPKGSPVHVSTSSTGADLESTPSRSGFSLGRQFRSTTRLPVNRNSVWEKSSTDSSQERPALRLLSLP